MPIEFNLNGKPVSVDADPSTPLLWVLRDNLRLCGTKYGCGVSQCGACTVHVDGSAVRSCVMPVSILSGKKVTTIEGLQGPIGAALAQAWTDPAAWEGMTQVGGVTLPGAIAGQIALDEVVLHAWDLARGTSQPYQQDPATLEACLAAMTGMYPPDDLDARKGIFEPPVPVPDNAPLVDRVVAYSGRDPGWPGR